MDNRRRMLLSGGVKPLIVLDTDHFENGSIYYQNGTVKLDMYGLYLKMAENAAVSIVDASGKPFNISGFKTLNVVCDTLIDKTVTYYINLLDAYLPPANGKQFVIPARGTYSFDITNTNPKKGIYISLSNPSATSAFRISKIWFE